MPKHSASRPTVAAHEPKRERGRLRVETIYEGAAAVFAEKGFEAATMTEIAARSGTAVGSLYRFFPSKESVGEFVTARAVQHVERGFNAIAERAQLLPPAALADELMDFKLSLGKHRTAAIASAEARGAGANARRRVVAAIRGEIAKMLAACTLSLPPARARAVAIVVVHLLDAAVVINEEDNGAERKRALAEIRELCRLYISSR